LSDEEREEEEEEDQEHKEERRREEHIEEERAREEHEEETERLEQHEEEEEVDERDEEAESVLVETLGRVKVATDRELKVRLEDDFFPWVVGRAIRRLLDGDVIDKVGYPGRRKVGRGEVAAFYVPHAIEYDSVKEIIKRKKAVSEGIANILMGGSSVSGHVEDLFQDAFLSLGFKFHGRDVSSFGGRKAVGVPSKEPPNLDFVFERDGVRYGIDVKNWIRYEWNSRDEVVSKLRVAADLGVVPFIVARYMDKDLVYKRIVQEGSLVYRYRHLLVPSVYESLAEAARELLGYPILAVDKLPGFKVDWIGKLHSAFVERVRV